MATSTGRRGDKCCCPVEHGTACAQPTTQCLTAWSQITREELVLSLRKQSKGFQRASSHFRGVTHHQKGKWEARIGQVRGLVYA